MSPYDPEKHVWIIDDQLHVIYKFTYDGKLVMTLGTKGKRGRDAGKLFDRPTDIAWLPDGTFFISDGYGGTRVAKFDKDGKFLMDWGTPPKDPKNPGPNEWNTVHSIAISKDRRLFVVDRGHRRIQVFDENGKFLDMWTTGVRSSPYAHLIIDRSVPLGGRRRHEPDPQVRPERQVSVRLGRTRRAARASSTVRTRSPSIRTATCTLAEVFNGRVQKFRPKPSADPAKVVGQELRYRAGS